MLVLRILSLSVALWAGDATTRPSPSTEAAALIEQMAAPTFAQREAAERRLRNMGDAVLPALWQRRHHPDAEVRRRIAVLLTGKTARFVLPEALEIIDKPDLERLDEAIALFFQYPIEAEVALQSRVNDPEHFLTGEFAREILTHVSRAASIAKRSSGARISTHYQRSAGQRAASVVERWKRAGVAATQPAPATRPAPSPAQVAEAIETIVAARTLQDADAAIDLLVRHPGPAAEAIERFLKTTKQKPRWAAYVRGRLASFESQRAAVTGKGPSPTDPQEAAYVRLRLDEIRTGIDRSVRNYINRDIQRQKQQRAKEEAQRRKKEQAEAARRKKDADATTRPATPKSTTAPK